MLPDPSDIVINFTALAFRQISIFITLTKVWRGNEIKIIYPTNQDEINPNPVGVSKGRTIISFKLINPDDTRYRNNQDPPWKKDDEYRFNMTTVYFDIDNIYVPGEVVTTLTRDRRTPPTPNPLNTTNSLLSTNQIEIPNLLIQDQKMVLISGVLFLLSKMNLTIMTKKYLKMLIIVKNVLPIN